MEPDVMYNKRKYVDGALRNILHKRLKHEEFEKVRTRVATRLCVCAVQKLLSARSIRIVC